MKQRELLSKRRFGPLFGVQFLGAMNDNIIKYALILPVTYDSLTVFGIAPEKMVASAGGLFILPYLLFSATAGEIAEKFEKSKLIKYIKFWEFGIVILASIALMTANYTMLLACLFLTGIQSTFFGPLKYSILPQHLPKEEELVAGNSLIQMGTQTAILLGTILGSVLITIKMSGPALTSGLLILTGLLGLVFAYKVPTASANNPDQKIHKNIIKPTWEIYQFTKDNQMVFWSVLGVSYFWFYGASLINVFPNYLKNVLYAGENVSSLFLAIFAIGISIGSWLYEKLSKGHLEMGLIPMGLTGMTLFTFDLFIIGEPFPPRTNLMGLGQFFSHFVSFRILFDFLMMTLFGGIFLVPLYYIMQTASPKKQRSRVIAGNNIINSFFVISASVTVIALYQLKVSLPAIFLLLAILNFKVLILTYFKIPFQSLRYLMKTIAHSLYSIRFKGLENIPDKGPAVFICNHVSFIDWIIIAAGMKKKLHYIIDYNFYNFWLFKSLLKAAGCIPIATAREDKEVLRQAYEKIDQALKNGECVCIFPEGAITYNGRLQDFKNGIVRILNRTPCPVIPMGLSGMWGSIFSRKGGAAFRTLPLPLRRKVELNFGPSIPYTKANTAHLKKKVQELLLHQDLN